MLECYIYILYVTHLILKSYQFHDRLPKSGVKIRFNNYPYYLIVKLKGHVKT